MASRVAGATPVSRRRLLPDLAPHGDSLAVIVLVITAVLLVAPTWLAGRVWIDGDLGDFYWPTMLTVFTAIRRGELPLWSPEMMGGFPLYADGSVGTLFPLNWVLVLWPNAFMLIPLGRMLLAALGMYAFLRLLRLRPLGAVIGALVFALNGFTASHFAHIDLSNGTAVLPYTLIAAELSVRARYWRQQFAWLIVAGLAHTLAWVSLHPQAPLMILPVYGLWVAYRGLSFRRWRGLPWIAAAVVLPLILALGLSAAQTLPMVELGERSPRHIWGPRFNGSFSLPPHNLIGLIWPTFIHSPAGGPQWSLWNLETLIYLGTLPLILAAIGFLARLRSRDTWFFTILALLALWVSLGFYVPISLQSLLYSLPGYNVLRAPARFFFVVGFAAAYLAAAGADWLTTRPPGTRTPLRIWAVLLGFAGLALSIPIVATIVFWLIDAVPHQVEAFIRVFYVDLPRIMPLRVDDVIYALQVKLAWHNPELWLAVSLLLVSVVLIATHLLRWTGRQVFAVAAVSLVIADLVYTGQLYITSVPLAQVTDPPPAMEYLDRHLGADRFFTATPVDSPPLSYLPFGIPDFNGQSSLRMDRPAHYTAVASEGESRLLDAAAVRYIMVPVTKVERREWSSAVGFRPDRPLATLDVDTPETLRTYSIPARRVGELRLVTALANAVGVRQGTEVAEIILSDERGATRRLPLRAGIETAEWAHEKRTVKPHVAHERPKSAYRWQNSDSQDPSYPMNLYLATLPLSLPDTFVIDKVAFRVLLPGVALRVYGATFLDPATSAVIVLERYQLPKYRLVYADGDAKIYACETALPRAYLVGQGVHVDSRRAAMDQLSAPRFDVTRRATIEGEIPKPAAAITVRPGSDPRAPLPAAPDRAGLGTVSIVDEDDTSVRLLAVAERPTFLILADKYYPGWEATIDGQPVPVLLANYTFRGIYLPPGRHNVEFSYTSVPYRLGVVVSFLTIAGLAAVLHFVAPRPHRPRSADAVPSADSHTSPPA